MILPQHAVQAAALRDRMGTAANCWHALDLAVSSAGLAHRDNRSAACANESARHQSSDALDERRACCVIYRVI